MTDDHARRLYVECNEARRSIKAVAEHVAAARRDASQAMIARAVDAEVIANVTLAFRHLEDASMRLGKALQALDGGVSVYDRGTTVGA